MFQSATLFGAFPFRSDARVDLDQCDRLLLRADAFAAIGCICSGSFPRASPILIGPQQSESRSPITGRSSLNQFLHGGWFHIIANMWTLWILGNNVEDRMGPVRFAIFYLLYGCVAGITHTLITVLAATQISGTISGSVPGDALAELKKLHDLQILRSPFLNSLGSQWFVRQKQDSH